MPKKAPKAPRPTRRELLQERRASRRKGSLQDVDQSAESNDWKREVTRLTFKTEAQRNYHRLILNNTLVIADGPAGTGKAQPLDAHLKTPTGWMTMGEVRVGDKLRMPDGSIAPVSAIYPQGEKDIWKLTFSDGRSAECCDEHLWRVYCGGWSPAETRWRVVDTTAIRAMLAKPSLSNRLYVELPRTEKVDDVELPLDPYLMGALLGNGHFGKGMLLFSTSDQFMVEEINRLLPPSTEMVHRADYGYAIVKRDRRLKGAPNEVLEALRQLELGELHSFNKFIPDIYLTASANQRSDLLQGLLDTDGTVSVPSGTASYSTSSPFLAVNVQYLVRSLGGLASIAIKHPTYTHKGEKREGRVAYQVNIRIADRKSLFRTPRKRELIPDTYQYADSIRLRIEKIEYVGRKEAQCISVDHPDHLYITNDFVVTHNTYVCTKWACQELDARRISKIIVTRPALEAGDEQMGFLPGTLEEKFAPYFEPFRRVMVDHFSQTVMENLMKRGRIEVAPLAYLRGLTFENAVVILDEAQNTTPAQMKLFLTRIGEGCTVIINGDNDQKDIRGKSGLEDAIQRFSTMEGVGHICFTDDDIVRSGFVREVLRRYRSS